jgi:hypothetical protein
MNKPTRLFTEKLGPLRAPSRGGWWWYFESESSEPVACWVVETCYAGEKFGIPTGGLTIGSMCGRREAGHLRGRDLRYIGGGFWWPFDAPKMPKYTELLWPNDQALRPMGGRE